ncbi:MAG: hypothetical protein ACRDIB_09375, partial [Ardenticatenaceae bacterium]
MQLALSSRSLGVTHPLEEDIRVAAITGFPWLLVDYDKMTTFLAQPDFDIRDLKRLFLRSQAAAVTGLFLPDSDPSRAPAVEAVCRDARRLGAPVVVLRIVEPDERIVQLAEIAERWSTVLALASGDPSRATFGAVRWLVANT